MKETSLVLKGTSGTGSSSTVTIKNADPNVSRNKATAFATALNTMQGENASTSKINLVVTDTTEIYPGI